MTAPDPDDRDPIPDWVETVTRIAGTLGFNQVRVRWKLQGWVNRRRAAARRREQTVARVTYEHRICRDCGAINDRGETSCTRCGQSLGLRALEIFGRLGLDVPRAISISALVGVMILAAYARIAFEHGTWLSSPARVLIEHGSTIPYDGEGWEWWRATTSMLLHADLIHLVFNLLALASVGPRAEELLGRGGAFSLFVLSGTIAALGSVWLGPPAIGVGASGGIMGLIGAVGAAGQRSGTARGRAVRDDMLKWVLYTFVFGMFVSADHHAHGIGLVIGVAFGLAAPLAWLTRARARRLQLALGGVAFVGFAAAMVAVVVPLGRGVHVAHPVAMDTYGDQWPTDDPGDPDDVGTMLWLCSDRVSAAEIEAFGGAAAVREICDSLGDLRRSCVEPSADTEPAVQAVLDRWCADLRRLDGAWPPPPRR